MAAQPQPHTGQSRVPSPTPTAADAQGDIYLSRRRLRHLTALNADAEIVNLLQQWEDPASPTKFQDCGAIAAAIKNGHKQLLKYLEDRGFSLFESGAVNAACDYAVCSGDLDFLNSLVEQGWDPNVTDSGKSRLDQVLGNSEVVLWFLAQGADPNAWCAYAVTAVTEAARSGSLHVLKLLISHGGTVTSTDGVAQAVSGDVQGFPDRLEIVDHLIDLGAPVDAYRYWYSGSEASSLKELYGVETGLQLAARGGRKEMVQLLLRRGADKTKKGGWRTKGETAFQIATVAGFKNIALLLKD